MSEAGSDREIDSWTSNARQWLGSRRLSTLLLSGLVGFVIGALYVNTQNNESSVPEPSDLISILSESGATDVSVVDDTLWGQGFLTQSRVVRFRVVVDNEKVQVLFQQPALLASIRGDRIADPNLVEATSIERIGETELLIRDEDQAYQLVAQCNGLFVNLFGSKTTQAEAQRQLGYGLMISVLSAVGCE